MRMHANRRPEGRSVLGATQGGRRGRLPGLLALVALLASWSVPEAEARKTDRLGGKAATAKLAASKQAQCGLVEILATNEKKGIDARLEKLRSKLTKPPFSAWDSFALLGEPQAKVERSKPAQVKLATGGTLTLLYKDKLVSQGGKARLRFGIDVDGKSGKRTVSTVVVFDSGETVLFAGEPHGKGTYILALTCQTTP